MTYRRHMIHYFSVAMMTLACGCLEQPALPEAALGQVAQGEVYNAPFACYQGAFCAYAGPNFEGTPMIVTEGDWSGGVYIQSYFNNGYPYPGFDHVQIQWYDPPGNFYSVCVHYAPGPGGFSETIHGYDAYVVSVRWRGECLPGEPQA